MKPNPLPKKEPIKIQPLCKNHRSELLRKAKYRPTDPWRALEICAGIAMFQGATATPTVWKKLDGDVYGIEKLGCLACRLPAKWAELLRVAKSRDLGEIKKLGELWLSKK